MGGVTLVGGKLVDAARGRELFRRNRNFQSPATMRVIAKAAISIHTEKIAAAQNPGRTISERTACATVEDLTKDGKNGSPATASRAPNHTANRVFEFRRPTTRSTSQAKAVISSPPGIAFRTRSVTIAARS